ncbi:hypothetical protein D9M71_828180 [compost metagenome]
MLVDPVFYSGFPEPPATTYLETGNLPISGKTVCRLLREFQVLGHFLQGHYVFRHFTGPYFELERIEENRGMANDECELAHGLAELFDLTAMGGV